jgi:CheY-like chemotaxis protein
MRFRQSLRWLIIAIIAVVLWTAYLYSQPWPAILLKTMTEAGMRLLTFSLNGSGHKVIQALDGEQAITIFGQGNSITLVITDLAMPKMTGFGLLTRMRQRWPNLPAILITGYLSPHVAEVVLNDNVKFLSKPIDLNELITTVERFTFPSV